MNTVDKSMPSRGSNAYGIVSTDRKERIRRAFSTLLAIAFLMSALSAYSQNCGHIIGIYIYDQITDTQAYGPITADEEIPLNGLPSSFYLAADVSGHIESVQVEVNGHVIEENNAPYTYPSGAQNGNSLPAQAATYHIDLRAFDQDNCAGNQCDRITLDFSIVGGCHNVSHPGSIQAPSSICAGNELYISNAVLPTGGAGQLQYIWLFNPYEANWQGSTAFNQNTPDFTHQPTQSGWYRRCARRSGCTEFTGETDWIHVALDNDCADITDGWNFSCEEGIEVELYSDGIKNALPVSMTFDSPENITQVAVEVVYKGCDPGNSIFFTDAAGNSYSAPRTTPIGGSTNVRVYRAILPSTSSVSYAETDDQNCAQSIVAYVFRQTGSQAATSGVFTNISGYNDIEIITIPIPSATGPRPVSLQIPISELTPDGRYIHIAAEAGSSTEMIFDNIHPDDFANGCCVKVFEMFLPQVAGNVTEIELTITTQNNGPLSGGVNGQSYVLAGAVNTRVGCACIAPEVTADGLAEQITVECGTDLPAPDLAGLDVLDYEETEGASVCGIALSSHPDYDWRNFWFHAMPEPYDKNFIWKDGYVQRNGDGTAEIYGRVENNSLPGSGFIIHYYFETLVDQATFLAAGGYNFTDAQADQRLYAKVDFSKPNSIVGFGEFTDSDLQLVSTGDVAFMDFGPRNVYGGEGVGFWIDYTGTINGSPAGAALHPNGTNHNDMYAATVNCSPEPDECETSLVSKWIIADDCGVGRPVVQSVTIIDTQAPVLVYGPGNVMIQCTDPIPTDEATFSDSCDDDLDIEVSESVTEEPSGRSIISRTYTATDDCGNTNDYTWTIIKEACNVTIGDYVWSDSDQDGIQDSDEEGVEGVTVQLISAGPDGNFGTADDVTVDTEVTDDDGRYLFEEVAAGEYKITFSDLPTDFVFTSTDQGGDDTNDSDANEMGMTVTFTVTPAQDDDLTFDAGIYRPVNVGDYVWLDTDQDGIQDPNEGGVEGVTVQLISAGPDGIFHTADDLITDTQTTDSEGAYLFENVLPGNYCVQFVENTIPEDLFFTQSGAGGDESTDSNADEEGKTAPFTITADQEDELTIDAGIHGCAEITPDQSSLPEDLSISCDESMPAANAPTFNALYDVEITVTFEESEVPQDCGRDIIRTWTATNDCGSMNQISQTIQIRDTEAPVIISSPDDMVIGCNDPLPNIVFEYLDNCDTELSIELSSTQIDLDCGGKEITFTQTATDDCGNAVSGTVKVSRMDNEAPQLVSGPEDITITCDEELSTPEQPTFEDSCDDQLDYTYEENESTDGDAVTTIVRSWTVADDCGNTAEYVQTITKSPCAISIGDYVWNDTDQDGIQDPDEEGVEGVTVELVSVGPDGVFGTADDEVVDTQVTDDNGQYLFEDVVPGEYKITFSDLPEEFVFTDADQGGDDTTDSDANEMGITEPFTIEPGQDDDLSFDAGIYSIVNIGDYVWLDTDQDGIQDPDEEGVEGVTVQLLSAGADGIFHTADDIVVDTATTDGQGEYLFENVLPGTYCIQFVESSLPEGLFFTLSGQGGDDTQDSNADETGKTTPFEVLSDQDDDLSFDTGIHNCNAITVEEGTAPEDLQIECDEPVPAPTPPTFVDIYDGNLSITFSESEETVDCGRDITRTWTATNYCGNTAEISQTIRVRDTTPPVVITAPDDITISCADPMPNLVFQFEDNCDTQLELTMESSSSGQADCNMVWTFTQTATDDCGNQTSASATVTVTDDTPPVINGVPEDITAQCGPIPAAAEVQLTDNCDDSPTLVVTEEDITENCRRTFTRTYTATDACGNSSSQTQTIVYEDTEPPIVILPEDAEVDCASMDIEPQTTGLASGADNCNDEVMIDFVDGELIGQCPQSFVRTWTVTDLCGNTSSGTQTIRIVDTTAPMITAPEDITLECSQETTTEIAGQATATDDCHEITITHADGPISGECPYTFVRTFTAEDQCGNTSTDVQTITIVDQTAPTVVSGPTDTEMSCDDIDLSGQEPQFADNCDEDIEVSYSEVGPATSCNGVITRTWTATDDCGNTTEFVQNVTVVDQVAPVFIDPPMDMTVDCAQVPEMVLPMAEDNCDSEVDVVFVGQEMTSVCPTIITRLWRATDECGNETAHSQTITIEDTTPPVLENVPADVIMQCGDLPAAPDVYAIDACTDEVQIEMIDEVLSESCPRTVRRTWTATDACGNQSTDEQLITFDDTEAPVISCPADSEVDCTLSEITPAIVGVASATDNCDQDISLTYVDGGISGQCPATFIRTWTAEDDCGNIATCQQTIRIVDETAPILDTPADLTIECSDDSSPSSTGQATAQDACGSVSLEYIDELIGEGCPYSIERRWTATDHCGNETSEVQTINVIDSTAPTIGAAPADMTISCEEPLPANEASFSDNCDPDLTIVMDEVSTPLDCGRSVSRTWTATDDCGNSTTHMQTITVIDETAPEFVNPPADVTVECTEIPAAPTLSALDNCDDNVNIVYQGQTVAGSCPMTFTRTWTATDLCGNTATHQQLITVEDTTAPEFVNAPDDLEVSCTDIPDPAVMSAVDACDDDVQIDFAEIVSQGACPYTITRTWTATDACGNARTHEQVITVIDELAPVFSAYEAQMEVSCDALDEIYVEATDNCDDSPVITYTDVLFSGSCYGTVERTYIATDNCGNESPAATQYLFIYDDEAPEFTDVPSDMTFECGESIPPAAEPSVVDNCDEDVDILFVEELSGVDCPYVITRSWTATDACGNETTYEQTITVVTTAPTQEVVTNSFPNPFSNQTTITFVLPEDGFIIHEVYNGVGQVIETIYKGYALGGIEYQITIETGDWNPGIYTSQLLYDNETHSNRVVKE